MSYESHNPRFLLASTAAALATIIIPVAVGLCVFLGGPSIFSNSTLDNAPYRASGSLLFFTPMIFTILLAIWYSITKGLFFWNVLTRTSLLLCCVVSSIIAGSIFSIDGYNAFGLRDAFIAFTVFSICTFVSLGFGWLVWWPIGFSGHKEDNSVEVKKPDG